MESVEGDSKYFLYTGPRYENNSGRWREVTGRFVKIILPPLSTLLQSLSLSQSANVKLSTQGEKIHNIKHVSLQAK